MVKLRTQAWIADTETAFDLPQGWDVTCYPPVDAPALDDPGMRESLANPIDTQTIAEIARGKHSAAIVVDDLSRPTPAADILPYVLSELNRAGVADGGIRIVIGGGSHRPLTEEEIAKKVGADAARRCKVYNHDAYSGELTGLGNLPDGTPVYINPVVADSDIKIGVAGVFPHPNAGFGGGAKIILPGVCGIATIAYFHSQFAYRGRGNIEEQGGQEDMRTIAEKTARLAGLDLVVNAVLNSRREVAGLFTGDVVAAHRAAAKFARRVYSTPIPRAGVQSCDIVIINAYPLDYDPVQVSKSAWPLEVFDKAYRVTISAASDGIPYHGLGEGMDYRRYLAQKQKASAVSVPGRVEVTSKDQFIMLSQNYSAADFYGRFENGLLFTDWRTLIGQLEHCQPRATVAVLPCSGIQLPEIVG